MAYDHPNPLQFPPEAEVARLADELSNTGRWGPDDQLGTLNHITADKRVRAAALVKSGRTASVARDLDTTPSERNPFPVRHVMRYNAHHAWAATDEVTIAPHGLAVTHLDALGHVFCEDLVYNNRRAEEVVTKTGLTFGDIAAQGEGIITRGVLLDVAAARGVPWLSETDGVAVDDLEAAEEHGGITVESGDAIFVRVGRAAREASEPANNGKRGGLMPDCLPWLHDRQVALYGGDCAEHNSAPYDNYFAYLHKVGLARMGLVLLDNPDVEPLAAACQAEGRHEFLFTAAPLRLPGGTGSPVNPICVF